MQQSHQHTTEEILLQVSVTKQQTEAGEKSVLNERGTETLMMTFLSSSSLMCNTLTFSVGAEFIGVFIYK